jgi:hypothetical protein
MCHRRGPQSGTAAAKTHGTALPLMRQGAPDDTSGEPAPPGFTKAYQYTAGGRTVTLTEQQYKAEAARAACPGIPNGLPDSGTLADLTK